MTLKRKQKAADYLDKLKSKFHNMGFITVSKDMKAQSNKPVMFKDTEAGNNMPAVKVKISAEGFPNSEDGYQKLPKDEELDILQQEFEEFTESRFGKKQQEAVEMVNKQIEELQKVLEKSGKRSIRQRAYQTEKIPDDFLEKILERARMHIAGLK